LPLSVVSESGALRVIHLRGAAGLWLASGAPIETPESVWAGCARTPALALVSRPGCCSKGLRSVGVKPGVEALATFWAITFCRSLR
jgi:hypothetical protein